MERNILENRIVITERNHQLKLFTHSIETENDRFLITEITDFSYRILSSTIYLVHLYTMSGVLTFQTIQNPDTFKKAFQQLKEAD